MKRPLLLWPTVLVCGAFIILAQSPPKLLIDVSTNSQVRLSWTNAATGFVVEELDHLPEASPWSPVLQAPQLANQQFSVVLSNTTGARFFRLTTRPGGLPPDPSFIALPVPTGVATLLGEATTFLYTGPDPIQTGVTNGTIDGKRAAILRGRITKHDNTPLSGVAVSILDHPEFGSTASRADGMFDLAVNGGGLLTVNYEKTGFCPVQRQATVPWQDYVTVADVVMILMDPLVTLVALGTNSPMQVHQGSMQSDADGARKAVLLFTPGTCASLVLANGTTQAVSSLNVRATEFTVGTNGPATMPAVLPPTSAYTYCAELSADEAMALGATIQFDRPVLNYVENFLNFPVGMAVPVGYLDRQKGVWVASANGRVIKILSVTGGEADVDTVGSESLPPLVLSIAERQQLATLYAAGQTLWRVPVAHFTPWDCNWPFVLPPDATAPNQPDPNDRDQDNSCQGAASSVIELQNQVLGESVEVVGTGFTLNYSGARVPGRTADNTLRIWLSGTSIPASLKRIDLTVQVAGRTFEQSFAPAPGQQTVFSWDGRDAYGRPVQGRQPLHASIGYVYDALYAAPAQLAAAFASFGATPLAANRARGELTLRQIIETEIGALDSRQLGLGGWSLSPHHAYDPVGRVLYLGDGRRRSAGSVNSSITTVAGTGALLSLPNYVAVAPDGTLYISDAGNRRIRRLGPDGIITTVAGTGTSGYNGDGIPATQARLSNAKGVAVSPDGGLYIADSSNHRVRRVGSNGIIATVAGTGTLGFSGDGLPATDARLLYPEDIAVGPDGSLYIADFGNYRIRRVGPDGIITTVAGTGAFGYNGDGILATQARLYYPQGVAVSPDGSLYIADRGNQRIRRVSPDGIITTVAGTGAFGYNGDGLRATQANLNLPIGVAVGSQGSLYITDFNNLRIRHVAPDGIITTVAGTGVSGFNGDGCPAGQANLRNPEGVAVGPDGSLYIADSGNHRVRRVQAPLPAFSAADFAVASEDGSLLYQFHADGRHLRTLDTLMGAVLHEFTYDAAGRLASVIEKTGGTDNVTTIERDGNGNPTAIVGPFGQRTILSVDVNGYLAGIKNAANETIQPAHTPMGLLTSFTDARTNAASYDYDSQGRLIRADDPAGGFKTLARTEATNDLTVTVGTASGRTNTYKIANLLTGARQSTVTFPTGLQNLQFEHTDGTISNRFPSGFKTTIVQGPDPRWGMLSPVAQLQIMTTPGGLTNTVTSARSAGLVDPQNLLSLSNLTDTVSVNGRNSTNTYTAATRTIVTRTPAGRTQTLTFDVLGRPIQRQIGGLAPISVGYDTRGRLTTASRGTGPDMRTFTLDYSSDGYLATITDPLGRTLSFAYDAAGREVTQTLPDASVIAFGYDATGNLTSLQPPGRPAHTLAYSPVNLATSYSPPTAFAGTNQTQYAYNTDRELTLITRPDGQTVQFDYSAGGGCNCGRLSSVTLARGTIGYEYDAATGNLTNIAAPGGINLHFTYDGPLLKSATWSGSITGVVAYTYDNDFRVTTNRVNGANAITFQYDADSLLVQAGLQSISRDAENGLRTGSTVGNVTDSWAYNAFAEPTNYSAAYLGTGLYSESYARDKLGRIIVKTEVIEGATNVFNCAYDLVSRLTNVTQNATNTASYTYGSNGNRLSRVTPSGTELGGYDDQDRLLSYGPNTYTYTAAGELLTRATGGQTTSYQYDELGNLLRVVLPDGTRLDYLIDGLNRRIGKQINGLLIQGFLYEDELRPIAELDGAGAVVSRFVYGAQYNIPAYLIKGANTYALVADHLGSPRLVVNVQTGAIAQRLDYDEYGNIILDTNPGFQPFGFGGGLYDPHTKLTRFGARDYDATSGTWTTKDPIGFDGLDANLFAYVRNDPVNLTDFAGTQVEPRIMKRPNETTLEYIIRRKKELAARADAAAKRAAAAAKDLAQGVAKGGKAFCIIFLDPRLFCSEFSDPSTGCPPPPPGQLY